MDALQNPKLYGEVLGDAWDLVKAGEAADINDALLKMAEKTGLPVRDDHGSEAGRQVLRAGRDGEGLLGRQAARTRLRLHGQMTHLLQDLVVNKALGGPRKSAEFRQLLGKAEGTVERYVWEGDQLVPSRFAQLPDTKPLQWEQAGESGIECQHANGRLRLAVHVRPVLHVRSGRADALKKPRSSPTARVLEAPAQRACRRGREVETERRSQTHSKGFIANRAQLCCPSTSATDLHETIRTTSDFFCRGAHPKERI